MLLVKRQKFPVNTLYLSYLIPSNVTTPPQDYNTPRGIFYMLDKK